MGELAKSSSKKHLYFKSSSAVPATSNLKENEYLIFEVPNELALEFENNQQGNLVLKGNYSHQAVLCSSNQTFALRKAETSNLFLLGEEQSFSDSEDPPQTTKDELSIAFMSKNTPESITGIVEIIYSGNHFVEVVKVSPSFEGLYHLLLPYKGQEDEARILQQGVTSLSTSELESRVQSSRDELLKYLESVDAFEFNGGWRVLTIEHLYYVLNLILLTMQGISMTISDPVRISNLMRSLSCDNIPEEAVFHVLIKHSSKIIGDHEFVLSSEKISRTFGEHILSSIEHEMSITNFYDSWKAACDIYSVEWDLCHLDGLCLIESDRLEPTIAYFPKHLLSINAKNRFQELFKIRSKWKKEDLLPYINDLAPSLKELDAMIIKYSRVSHHMKNTTFLSARNASYGNK